MVRTGKGHAEPPAAMDDVDDATQVTTQEGRRRAGVNRQSQQPSAQEHQRAVRHASGAKRTVNAMSAEDQEAFQAAASEAINWSQAEHIAMEEQLIGEFEAAGLNIYEPDQDAFRVYAQEQYLNSDISASWPEGALEAINAL